jgi:single-strand DNA-binding protein
MKNGYSRNDNEFMGRIGNELVLKDIGQNEIVLEISLAVTKSWKDKDSGERKESTTWIPLKAYGVIAQNIEKACKKGDKVFFDAEYYSGVKEKKDGSKDYWHYFKIDNFVMINKL